MVQSKFIQDGHKSISLILIKSMCKGKKINGILE
jgi:hypothetical protein